MSELPNTSSAVIARIRAWAAANDWRKSRLAGEAGLPDTTLRSFDSEDWNPTLETIERLERIIPAGWQAGDPLPPKPAPAPPPSKTDAPAIAQEPEVAAAPAAPFPGARTAKAAA